MHNLPRRSLVPKYRTVWRYTLNFNFIYTHKNVLPSLHLFYGTQQRYLVQIYYTEFYV